MLAMHRSSRLMNHRNKIDLEITILQFAQIFLFSIYNFNVEFALLTLSMLHDVCVDNEDHHND